MTPPSQLDPPESDTMKAEIGTLIDRSVDTALEVHRQVVRIYEEAWNAHTFDFEDDVGHFMAPDVSIVLGAMLGGRSLLREASEARADYVRGTAATVTMNLEVASVADLDTAVVAITEGDITFTYPDRTVYTQPVLTSATLRLLDGRWVFQHIHLGRGCC
jgi:hypothetical protein